jgi:hypothetical protein
MATPRYSVAKHISGTWSVTDAVTGEVAEVHGVLLIGLGNGLANDMAEMMNDEDRKMKPKVIP